MVVHRRTITFQVEEDENGWFIASVPELPGVHTHGKTIGQSERRLAEALLCVLESYADGEVPWQRFPALDPEDMSASWDLDDVEEWSE